MLRDRYWILSTLGQGGMGVTYRAWDVHQSCPVVVKMPREDLRGDAATVRRFVQELHAMLALKHQHIVPITDYGDDGDTPYVVMRLLPGGSLADHRVREGIIVPMMPGTLYCWLPGIAHALDFIHSRGIMHRDVKPANIFFDAFLKSFLGDFGIAKAIDDGQAAPRDQGLTGEHHAIGTPDYMAPEHFTNASPPNGKADQYSLAVTVYEILAGSKPFTGADVVKQHITAPLPQMDRLALAIPDSLWVALERALSKPPEDRFPTCIDFVKAALRDIERLPSEPNTARLRCQKCATIIKLNASNAGKSGRCPQCKSRMGIADDLSTVWLHEDQHVPGTVAKPQQNDPPGPSLLEEVVDPLPRASGRWRVPRSWIPAVAIDSRQWAAAGIAAAVTALVMGPSVAWTTWSLTSRNRRHHEVTVEKTAPFSVMEVDGTSRHGTGDGEEPDALVQETSWAAERARRQEGDPSAARLSPRPDDVRVEHATDAPTRGEVIRAAMDVGIEGPGVAGEPAGPILAIDAQSRNSSVVIEQLVQQRPFAIVLNGLASLTPEEVDRLAEYQGNLYLDDLTVLDPQDAQKLVKGRQGVLSLNRMEALSDAVADALGKKQGELRLDGVLELTPTGAKELAVGQRERASLLSLRGLRSISPAVASELARYRGVLILDGLVELSRDAAGKFAQHKHPLSLNGMVLLAPDVAQELGKHWGGLSLTGLTDLSSVSAGRLFKPAKNRVVLSRAILSRVDAVTRDFLNGSELVDFEPLEDASAGDR